MHQDEQSNKKINSDAVWAGLMAQVVVLPSKHEDLSSNLNTIKKKKESERKAISHKMYETATGVTQHPLHSKLFLINRRSTL
jgi:hypothetical protein